MHKDEKSGWNLELITENFAFAPEQVNQAHRVGHGHAHLYINGKKITRLYSHWYHLEELPEGKHLIKVNLNTNDHQDYALNGKVIGAEVEINQKRKGLQ
ncbi:hypothetical protein [Kangiella sp. HZ709]|uniref:hypothetical protein n=1 Tax=Kangiella sp. HZ709 TaxID=2666328 RepID=UPI0012AF077A|nr:hypothetical protein [Kangiella sp. HZ709]MRX27987.1 hypothetical protein [Kangiella sp. HZ709]